MLLLKAVCGVFGNWGAVIVFAKIESLRDECPPATNASDLSERPSHRLVTPYSSEQPQLLVLSKLLEPAISNGCTHSQTHCDTSLIFP